MKLLKNTYTQCVCLTGLVLLIGGCAASSSAPVTAQSTGTTYECEAGDTSWDCRAQGAEGETSVAPTIENTPAQAGESSPANNSWWRIRTRGGESTNNTRRDKPAVASTERRERRTVAKADAPKRERRGLFGIRMRGRDDTTPTTQAPERAATQPAQVVESSPAPAARQTTTSNPPIVAIGTRPSERLSAKPADTSSRQTVRQPTNAVSSNPATTPRQPVVVMQVPRSGESGTTAVRRVASPANPDIPLDGLGGDYDYAVQLAAFTNYGLSSDFLSSYPSLDLMRVKTQSKGKTFYIVIAGTFENKQLASAQSQMLTSTYGMDEPYIRTVRSIRSVQIN